MKEFLEDLEALLIKHPDIAMCSRDYMRGVYICDFGGDSDDMVSADRELTVADIQRFNRELEAEQ